MQGSSVVLQTRFKSVVFPALARPITRIRKRWYCCWIIDSFMLVREGRIWESIFCVAGNLRILLSILRVPLSANGRLSRDWLGMRPRGIGQGRVCGPSVFGTTCLISSLYGILQDQPCKGHEKLTSQLAKPRPSTTSHSCEDACQSTTWWRC